MTLLLKSAKTHKPQAASVMDIVQTNRSLASQNWDLPRRFSSYQRGFLMACFLKLTEKQISTWACAWPRIWSVILTVTPKCVSHHNPSPNLPWASRAQLEDGRTREMSWHCSITVGVRGNSVASLAASFSELRASLVAQLVKNLPAIQVTQFRFLGWEDPLEEEMPTQSTFLAWEIPWTEEPGGLQSMRSQTSDAT